MLLIVTSASTTNTATVILQHVQQLQRRSDARRREGEEGKQPCHIFVLFFHLSRRPQSPLRHKLLFAPVIFLFLYHLGMGCRLLAHRAARSSYTSPLRFFLVPRVAGLFGRRAANGRELSALFCWGCFLSPSSSLRDMYTVPGY